MYVCIYIHAIVVYVIVGVSLFIGGWARGPFASNCLCLRIFNPAIGHHETTKFQIDRAYLEAMRDGNFVVSGVRRVKI